MQPSTKKQYARLAHHSLGPTIGKGTFAKVKLAYCDFTNNIFAIKVFKKHQDNFNEQLVLEEAQTLKLIEHKNVPAFFGFYKSASYVKRDGQEYEVAAIVMEHVENGELFDYFVASQRGFSEDVARTWFRSLIETIGDFHDQGIAHRDLKIENLLLDRDFNLKVGDFGFAASIRNEKGEILLLKGRFGTPEYMAPEISYQASYNGAAVDVFSCGVILFLLVTASFPFKLSLKRTDPLYGKIAMKNYKSFWEDVEKWTGKKLSVEFKDLINSMLAFNPSERLTIQKIKDHPWMKGPVLDSEALKKSMESLKEKVNDIRFENREREKKEAAETKALAKKMTEEKFKAPLAFTGVHIKK